MRLIDADALMFELKHTYFPQDVAFGQGRYSVYEQIDQAPIIEAKPVRHGKWYLSEQGADTVLMPNIMSYVPTRTVRRCSLCHSAMEVGGVQKEPAKYCPNCGARMDGDENG